MWRIIVSGNQLAVQRSITLTVGIPQTVVVTVSGSLLPNYKQATSPVVLLTSLLATPTIVLGITSTPRAQSTKPRLLREFVEAMLNLFGF